MDYVTAGIRMHLPKELVRGHFAKALAPFAIDSTDSDPGQVPGLSLQRGIPARESDGYREIDVFDFPDAGADCRLGHDAAGYLFEMKLRETGTKVYFRKALHSNVVTTDLTPDQDPALLRFGLWMTFNLTAIGSGVTAVHASTICHRGGAVLVLGESGTGKSTHTRLWREHIGGAELLNDDSPFLHLADGRPVICGSPWSGKTPCYKNIEVPLRAIVRLSQAPHNRIRSLSKIEAYGALLPSFPPSFTHDEPLFDALNALASVVLAQTPAYHLECRPDAAAARLCCDTVFGNRQ